VIERVLQSMRHWCRLVGGASEGASVLERDGVVAAVVPAAPERAVVNSALYRDAEALEAAYDELAAAYEEIGAKWTVWVPPGDEAAARFLEGRGHVLDAQPMAMGRELDVVERPPADAIADWTARGSLADVGEINDRSYAFGTDSFARSLRAMPEGAAHIYVAREDGRAIGCLMTADHEGNSEVQMVAVIPEARGRGLTRKLLGHALADAAERGNETSTLIATSAGYPVYERLGFRPLERFSMWELTPAPPPPRT
jgi:N-acetylglutamate synthase-like GNAT family acetyltransferase